MSDPNKDSWISLLLQQRLGKYQATDYRGGGEFGLVFAGVHVETGKEVALKVLPPTPDGMRNIEFDDEGRLLRKLERASHIIDVFESGNEYIMMMATATSPGVPVPFRYHALELADGSLDELIENEELRRKITWPEKLSIWRDAVKGIHQMHLSNCVHRDLKCSNVLMFTRRFGRIECHLTDLGRAKDVAEKPRLMRHEYAIGRGDLRFAPPECIYLQATGTPEAFRCEDLYGLGSLFFEICTGQGITSMALGHGPSLVEEAYAELMHGRRRDLSGLRSHYNKALATLEPEIPSVIRDRAMTIVQQLCDPIPAQRFPRTFGRRSQNQPGLSWLFRQIDIMTKTLNVPRQRGRRSSDGR